MSIFVLATLDTKGHEAAYLCKRLQAGGLETVLIDCGSRGEPQVPADISRDVVFDAAGKILAALDTATPRGTAVNLAAIGAAKICRRSYDEGKLSGVMALGGSAGTTIGTMAMRSLPLGVPKVMISTMASGQTRPYVGNKDIVMIHSVVDVAGLNRISRIVFNEACQAMIGMVQKPAAEEKDEDKPLIAATMFGVTTPCVDAARKRLEEAGYEVVVFHATGVGGQAMESLIDEKRFAGVLDVTTTEIADEIAGGVLSAGPERLTAACRRAIPQVVSFGALDMVNFGPRRAVPERFEGRKFHAHNANVTLMRTTVSECRSIGDDIGQKLATAQGPVAVLYPRQGISALDCEGGVFEDPLAREALLTAVRTAAPRVEVTELDLHINDPAFGVALAEKLLSLMGVTAEANA
jgi:uncharacterized protein (UPF0261 family)